MEGKTVGLVVKEDCGGVLLVKRAIRATKAMMAKRETAVIERGATGAVAPALEPSCKGWTSE